MCEFTFVEKKFELLNINETKELIVGEKKKKEVKTHTLVYLGEAAGEQEKGSRFLGINIKEAVIVITNIHTGKESL